MMWLLLYGAFGIVALWLLGEVLLQYKARLRWRLLAFFGFLGVVAGVLTQSVPVIGLGVIIFAFGQVKVTLSYRRGFSTGWAIGGGPGSSRRRRDEEPMGAYEDGYEQPEPVVNPYDELGGYQGAPEPAGFPQQQAPQEQTAQFAAFGQEQQSYPATSGGYDSYSGSYDTGSYDTGGYATVGYPQGQDQQVYADQASSYDTAAGQYAGYTEPYSGTQYAETPSYYDSAPQSASYDTSYGTSYDASYPQQPPSYEPQQSWAPDPYATNGGGGYGPDGAWVPQQREGDTGQYPQQGEYTGYEEQQYRY